MHIIVTVLFISAFFIYGKISEIKKYEATIMYVIIANLFYLFLCANYWMWEYKPYGLLNQFCIDMTYTFIVLPIATFLFLKFAPYQDGQLKILKHIFQWTIPFFFGEWIFYQFGAMTYSNGWSILWSALFYLFMFPLLLIHHKNRTLAYIISVIFITYLIIHFKVPINVPVQDR